MWTFELTSMLAVFVVTIVGGAYPFLRKRKQGDCAEHYFPLGEALAAGVFLGAGLLHMLSEATRELHQLHYVYPLALLVAGATFLFFLLCEHIGMELYRDQTSRRAFAVLAVVMLSLHSFVEGVTLGIIDSMSTGIIILFAIIAHKWAASFALSIQINTSELTTKVGLLLFLVFSIMVPLGIVFGTVVNHTLVLHPLLQPVLMAVAAGTFLYLGTLHGLERAVLIKQCCNLRGFSYMILGFVVMAVAAVWA